MGRLTIDLRLGDGLRLDIDGRPTCCCPVTGSLRAPVPLAFDVGDTIRILDHPARPTFRVVALAPVDVGTEGIIEWVPRDT